MGRSRSRLQDDPEAQCRKCRRPARPRKTRRAKRGESGQCPLLGRALPSRRCGRQQRGGLNWRTPLRTRMILERCCSGSSRASPAARPKRPAPSQPAAGSTCSNSRPRRHPIRHDAARAPRAAARGVEFAASVPVFAGHEVATGRNETDEQRAADKRSERRAASSPSCATSSRTPPTTTTTTARTRSSSAFRSCH